ncbi:MAG: EAL domain-containing protein, partial [Halothiobacillaceae bacterium]
KTTSHFGYAGPLTETVLMQDPDTATQILRELADHGIRVAIDDFGTGYSSMAYLRNLPIDALKIDRTFVGDMLENEHDEVIVRTTIALGHNLGLKVIAEGVEDAATLDRLRDMGCDQAQGYHIGRPAPLA